MCLVNLPITRLNLEGSLVLGKEECIFPLPELFHPPQQHLWFCVPHSWWLIENTTEEFRGSGKCYSNSETALISLLKLRLDFSTFLSLSHFSTSPLHIGVICGYSVHFFPGRTPKVISQRRKPELDQPLHTHAPVTFTNTCICDISEMRLGIQRTLKWPEVQHYYCSYRCNNPANMYKLCLWPFTIS